VGTRLQDFTTGSNRLFAPGARFIAVNVCRHDAIKWNALELRGDALAVLQELDGELGDFETRRDGRARARQRIAEWNDAVTAAVAPAPADAGGRPGDAQVIGVVNAFAQADSTLVCAAGGLPGELHKLWRTPGPGGYHVEYGYSCMGYEIAGGLGVKMAHPEREVIVVVGDGSYLMMNSEIATSVALGHKLIVVLLDNRGFGCIERLQASCGGESFNNLLGDAAPRIDFAAHARALGAGAVHVAGLEALAAALAAARAAGITQVIVIDTDPARATAAGGAWWEVPVASVSASARVREAYLDYLGVKNPEPGNSPPS
jgi:3D-(3,5/4)-trihydroxycyclohexane-1,2-dione acylhydrolase (decyclizing)